MDLYTEYKELSSETKLRIEQEVRRILDECSQRATKVLTERRHDLDALANALVEYEVLNEDEIKRILRGEKLTKLKTLPNMPIKLPEIPLPPRLGGPGEKELGGGGGGLGVPGVPGASGSG